VLRLLLTGLAERVAGSPRDRAVVVSKSIPKHGLDTWIMADLPPTAELEYRGETDFGIRVTC
jgi:hypothetical protein